MQTPLDVIQASFALPLSSRLARMVDVVLFNPPYVPTSDEEARSAQAHGGSDAKGFIAGAWAGGDDGMNVTNIFLDQVEVCQSVL